MIRVLFIAPGATVRDLGRDGFQAQGLDRAGAMDVLSHRIANKLLGNDAAAATIEIPLGPATLRFTKEANLALAGAACGTTLAGRPLPRIRAGRAGRAGAGAGTDDRRCIGHPGPARRRRCPNCAVIAQPPAARGVRRAGVDVS